MSHYTRRCLTAAGLLLLAGGAVNAIWFRRAPEVRYEVTFADTPLQVGELRGELVPVEKRIFDYIGADAMREIEYRSPRGRRVRLSLVYGRDWRAVHNPLQCYLGQGWSVDEKRAVKLPAPPDCPHAGPLHGMLLSVHKAGVSMRAVYVFAHQGGTESDWTTQGWAVAGSPRGTGGVLLSLSAPVAGDDGEAALALLTEVLDTVYPSVVAFWYPPQTTSQQR
jgi:hypothetical protein